MKVQDAKRQIRLQEWSEQINSCRQSGLTVKGWCKENGIHIKTYYNRMKRVREELLDALESGKGNQLAKLKKAGRNDIVQIENLVELESKQQNTPMFAMLPPMHMDIVAVKVHIGAHVAEIQNSADSEMVESVLRTLASL